MERRRETRFQPDQPVRLTVLSDNDRRLTARMVNISGKGISLAAQEKLEVGAAVRIDFDDSLWLGEVCHCHEQGQDQIIGIKLDQVIPSISELARLVSAVMGESDVKQRDRARP